MKLSELIQKLKMIAGDPDVILSLPVDDREEMLVGVRLRTNDDTGTTVLVLESE